MTPEHFRRTVQGWKDCHEGAKEQFTPAVEAMLTPAVRGEAATYWKRRVEALLGRMTLSRLMRGQVQEMTPDVLAVVLKAYVVENLP